MNIQEKRDKIYRLFRFKFQIFDRLIKIDDEFNVFVEIF